MKKRFWNEFRTLAGGDFAESTLVESNLVDLPDVATFKIWSPNDQTCYNVVAETILEYHFARTGVGPIGAPADLPLSNVYVTFNEEFRYWQGMISAFRSQRIDDGADPVCLEFDSHLFANRRYEPLTRDRNAGLLVVCRKVRVEPERISRND